MACLLGLWGPLAAARTVSTVQGGSEMQYTCWHNLTKSGTGYWSWNGDIFGNRHIAEVPACRYAGFSGEQVGFSAEITFPWDSMSGSVAYSFTGLDPRRAYRAHIHFNHLDLGLGTVTESASVTGPACGPWQHFDPSDHRGGTVDIGGPARPDASGTLLVIVSFRVRHNLWTFAIAPERAWVTPA